MRRSQSFVDEKNSLLNRVQQVRRRQTIVKSYKRKFLYAPSSAILLALAGLVCTAFMSMSFEPLPSNDVVLTTKHILPELKVMFDDSFEMIDFLPEEVEAIVEVAPVVQQSIRAAVMPTEPLNRTELSVYIDRYRGIVPHDWVTYIIHAESRHKPDAVSWMSPRNGRGLMQVSEYALIDYNRHNRTSYQPNQLFDVETNIKIGCWYLNWMLHHYLNYELDFMKLYIIYNVGPGNYINYYESYYARGRLPSGGVYNIQANLNNVFRELHQETEYVNDERTD